MRIRLSGGIHCHQGLLKDLDRRINSLLAGSARSILENSLGLHPRGLARGWWDVRGGGFGVTHFEQRLVEKGDREESRIESRGWSSSSRR